MTRPKKKPTLSIVAGLFPGLVALVLFNPPKPVEASDATFNLTQMADGTYLGSCDNGMGSVAEVITDKVVQQQSVEVDAISGATMSSKTILKAVEIALSERQEVK